MRKRTPQTSSLVLIFAAALELVSCSYGYGPKLNTPVAFSGSGWDSGLAYGDAVESATGHVRDPDAPARVSMNCYMYAFKPIVSFAGGAIAISTKSTPFIVAALVGAAVFALLPNCFGTLVYDLQPDPQTQTPVRRKTPATDDDGGPLRPVRNKSEILFPPPANGPEQQDSPAQP